MSRSFYEFLKFGGIESKAFGGHGLDVLACQGFVEVGEVEHVLATMLAGGVASQESLQLGNCSNRSIGRYAAQRQEVTRTNQVSAFNFLADDGVIVSFSLAFIFEAGIDGNQLGDPLIQIIGDAILDAVVAPVNEAAEVLEKLASRDLSARVKGAYKGGHARIKDALNTAADNLDQSLSQVAVSASQVDSAAGQVNSGSQSLAEGSSEQASSLEQISSSLAEVRSMSQQNATNAQQAKSMADATSASTQKGRR